MLIVSKIISFDFPFERKMNRLFLLKKINGTISLLKTRWDSQQHRPKYGNTSLKKFKHSILLALWYYVSIVSFRRKTRKTSRKNFSAKIQTNSNSSAVFTFSSLTRQTNLHENQGNENNFQKRCFH